MFREWLPARSMRILGLRFLFSGLDHGSHPPAHDYSLRLLNLSFVAVGVDNACHFGSSSRLHPRTCNTNLVSVIGIRAPNFTLSQFSNVGIGAPLLYRIGSQ